MANKFYILNPKCWKWFNIQSELISSYHTKYNHTD